MVNNVGNIAKPEFKALRIKRGAPEPLWRLTGSHGGWASFPALVLARGDIEHVVDAFQRFVPIPQHVTNAPCSSAAGPTRSRAVAGGRPPEGEDCVGNPRERSSTITRRPHLTTISIRPGNDGKLIVEGALLISSGANVVASSPSKSRPSRA